MPGAHHSGTLPIHITGQAFDHHSGSAMNTNEIDYSLEPTTFHSMQEAQELANTLEENLQNRRTGAASVRPEIVEVFSELVNNAAEHGMTPEGATPTSVTCLTGRATHSTWWSRTPE